VSVVSSFMENVGVETLPLWHMTAMENLFNALQPLAERSPIWSTDLQEMVSTTINTYGLFLFFLLFYVWNSFVPSILNNNQALHIVYSEKECLSYATLSSASRSSTYQLPKGRTPSCDDDLPTRWYRFSNPAGDKMASSCPPSERCGTVLTGWLATTHPKTTDGIVSGKVCFHWKSGCCQFSQNIHLRNCGRFYVYKLGKTFGCPMGFCGVTS